MKHIFIGCVLEQGMFQKTLAVAAVTGIIFLVPVLVYGVFERLGLAEIPGGSPASFLAGVLVSKIGTAIAFVMFFSLTRSEIGQNWLLYALIWWVMYVFGEIGQAMGPDYPLSEAVAGIIPEAIYFPLSAYLIYRMMG
jgi:hypothetical protein